VLALVLGLGAGIVYGVADFVGGLASRRSPLVSVLLISQIFGTTILLVAFPFISEGDPTGRALGWGAAAGAAGAIGVAFLYRGLACGRMSIVAPITAVNAAALPVVFGLAKGERPGTIALTGAVLSLVAIAFVSSSGPVGDRGRRKVLDEPGLVDALSAGIGFGFFFIFLSFAPDDSSMWPLAGARVSSLSLLALTALVTRSPVRTPTGVLPLIAAAGMLDVAANLLYLLATREGLLSLVAVLTSLYPVSTVVLARLVLDERLGRVQLFGLVLAASGVTMIAVR
jgi:drug/metabolite transporter (DMT)-like permease